MTLLTLKKNLKGKNTSLTESPILERGGRWLPDIKNLNRA